MAQQKINIKEDNGSKTMRVLDTLTPKNTAAAPAINADYLGQIHVDELAKKAYIAIAVGSEIKANDWQEIAAPAAG